MSTVNDIIQRYKEILTVKRKRAGGRKRGIVNQKLALKVVNCVKKKSNATELDKTTKFGVSASWVRKAMVSANLKTYHVQ